MAIVVSVKGAIKSKRHLNFAMNYVLSPETIDNDFKEAKEHIDNAVKYVAKKEKAKYVSYLNCHDIDVVKQFELTRKAYNKDNNILCHHYVQSFAPGEVTAEQAHKIGVELMEKLGVGYQVVISTHIDRQHIHNHILINSVSTLTGEKWKDNQSSLKAIREVNDFLCQKENLSVVAVKIKNGVSKNSYVAESKGISWKKSIVEDLENVLKTAKNKDEFITQLENKNYEVKYNDVHITLKKKGMDKGVRVDTLAKQFGEKYYKFNIDKQLNVNTDIYKLKQEWLNARYVNYEDVAYKNAFKQYSEWTFSPKNFLPQLMNSEKGRIARKRIDRSLLKSIAFTKNPYKIAGKIFAYFLLRQQMNLTNEYSKYKQWSKISNLQRLYKQPTKRMYEDSPPTRQLGNINYRTLVSSLGDNTTITVQDKDLMKFVNAPIFYSAKLTNNGKALLTFKTTDRIIVDTLLNKGKSKVDTRVHFEKKKDVYAALKERGAEIYYKKITEGQARVLLKSGLEVAIRKDEKVCIAAFEKKNCALVDELLERNCVAGKLNYKALKEFERLYNTNLKYKKISKEELARLQNFGIGIPAAGFLREDKNYNLAYLPKDENRINEIIYSAHQTYLFGKTDYKELKHLAEKNGVKLNYKKISPDMFELLEKSNLNIPSTVFYDKNAENYNLAYLPKDEDDIRNVIYCSGEPDLKHRPIKPQNRGKPSGGFTL